MKDPLIDMQTRLAFMDDMLQSLNDAVSAHDQKLARMERSLVMLREQLQALPADAGTPDDDLPPHY